MDRSVFCQSDGFRPSLCKNARLACFQGSFYHSRPRENAIASVLRGQDVQGRSQVLVFTQPGPRAALRPSTMNGCLQTITRHSAQMFRSSSAAKRDLVVLLVTGNGGSLRYRGSRRSGVITLDKSSKMNCILARSSTLVNAQLGYMLSKAVRMTAKILSWLYLTNSSH